MSDAEKLRAIVAQIDALAGDALSLIDSDEDTDCDLDEALTSLQAAITDWQEAKGFI